MLAEFVIELSGQIKSEAQIESGIKRLSPITITFNSTIRSQLTHLPIVKGLEL